MKKLPSFASVVLCLSLTACGGTSEAKTASSSPSPTTRAPSSAAAIKNACDTMMVLNLGADKITPTNSAANIAYIQKMVDIANEQRDTGPWELRESFDSLSGALNSLNGLFKGQASSSDVDKALKRMDSSSDTYNRLCTR